MAIRFLPCAQGVCPSKTIVMEEKVPCLLAMTTTTSATVILSMRPREIIIYAILLITTKPC